MNKSVKTFMLASLAAFSCSITACANNQGVGVDEVNNGSVANDSGQVSNLFTVSKRTTTPTDFTYAAENTVNGVVSIKSFATPLFWPEPLSQTPTTATTRGTRTKTIGLGIWSNYKFRWLYCNKQSCY